ncbi:MAG: hypothetical protein JNL66_24260 [Alphaproteobacteria bacterium]|nr:hypothetical protein [Alphaproteobacteria bacterium]
MRLLAGLVGAFLASAATALAQPAATQFVDLAVLSIEVRGPSVRPGAPLQVSARILRRDGGAPSALDAVIRFHAAGDARPFAERRITLPPDGGAVVTVPWPARAGRHVISVAVGVMTPRAIDRTRGNDVLTTADIIVPTAARPAADTPIAIAAAPLAARAAAPVAVGAAALAASSAPRTTIAAGALGAASAPRAPIAAGALGAASAPRSTVAAGSLSLRSAGPTPISASPLAASSAPRQPVAAAPLSAASAPPPPAPAPAAAAGDAPAGAPAPSTPRQP